ncbi:MAG: 50S ribosomal protein L27 [Patescibacteria group bacterium]|mgnify:FL=1
MAHKKAGGSTALGRESQSKRLGVKLPEGAFAKSGSILIRQRGTKFHPGKNVKRGKDDTLYSIIKGFVHFSRLKRLAFDGVQKQRTYVSVLTEKSVPKKTI